MAKYLLVLLGVVLGRLVARVGGGRTLALGGLAACVDGRVARVAAAAESDLRKQFTQSEIKEG
jgi:hypothetical protein